MTDSLETINSRLIADKHDKNTESLLRGWLKELRLVSDTSDQQSFQELLRDGTVLCGLINVLIPGFITKINSPNSPPFKQMENISSYLNCCSELGIEQSLLFDSLALYEGKDINRVLAHLHHVCKTKDALIGLGKKVLRERLKGSRPALRHSPSAPASSQATNTPPNQTRNRSGTTPAHRMSLPVDQINSQSMASKQMSMDTRRSPKKGATITMGGSPLDRQMSFDSFMQHRSERSPRRSIEVSNLASDIAAKEELKRNPELERMAKDWISRILNTEISGDIFVILKSGVVLCKLANAIKPGVVQKINEHTNVSFRQMENIGNYIRACETMGLSSSECFDTPDLYESKNLSSVISNIHALANLVKKFPDYNGPLMEREERRKTRTPFSVSLVPQTEEADVLFDWVSQHLEKEGQDVEIGNLPQIFWLWFLCKKNEEEEDLHSEVEPDQEGLPEREDEILGKDEEVMGSDQKMISQSPTTSLHIDKSTRHSDKPVHHGDKSKQHGDKPVQHGDKSIEQVDEPKEEIVKVKMIKSKNEDDKKENLEEGEDVGRHVPKHMSRAMNRVTSQRRNLNTVFQDERSVQVENQVQVEVQVERPKSRADRLVEARTDLVSDTGSSRMEDSTSTSTSTRVQVENPLSEISPKSERSFTDLADRLNIPDEVIEFIQTPPTSQLHASPKHRPKSMRARGFSLKGLDKAWAEFHQLEFPENTDELTEQLYAHAKGLPLPKNARPSLPWLTSTSSSDLEISKSRSNNWKVGDLLVKSYFAKEDVNKRGLRRAKKPLTMEDMNFAESPFQENTKGALFCVFDGHGGKECAQAVRDIFPQKFFEVLKEMDPKRVFTDYSASFPRVFAQVDAMLLAHEYQGCTATVIYLWEVDGQRYFQSANVGDSAAFLARGEHALALTQEHKPVNPDERNRLIGDGIEIAENATRVGGLSVSRALGDHFLKQEKAGLISEPFVSPAHRIGDQDTLIVLASDGLWDVMSGDRALELAKHFSGANEISRGLMEAALAHPKCLDNVTIISIEL